MHSTALLLAFPVLGLVLYTLISSIVTNVKRSRKAKQLGCGEAPILPSPDPLGIVNLYWFLKTGQEGWFFDYIRGRVEKMATEGGKHIPTIIQNQVFRNRFFMTWEPKNIQALLATQFKDFALGPVRHGIFSPL